MVKVEAAKPLRKYHQLVPSTTTNQTLENNNLAWRPGASKVVWTAPLGSTVISYFNVQEMVLQAAQVVEMVGPRRQSSLLTVVLWGVQGSSPKLAVAGTHRPRGRVRSGISR